MGVGQSVVVERVGNLDSMFIRSSAGDLPDEIRRLKMMFGSCKCLEESVCSYSYLVEFHTFADKLEDTLSRASTDISEPSEGKPTSRATKKLNDGQLKSIIAKKSRNSKPFSLISIPGRTGSLLLRLPVLGRSRVGKDSSSLKTESPLGQRRVKTRPYRTRCLLGSRALKGNSRIRCRTIKKLRRQHQLTEPL